MGLRERIGIDFGGKQRLEEALEWAAANQVVVADVCVGQAPNELGSFDDQRVLEVRAALEDMRRGRDDLVRIAGRESAR